MGRLAIAKHNFLKVSSLVTILLALSVGLIAAEPEVYIKKATWQETVRASREMLVKMLERQSSASERRAIWQQAERDFNTFDALNEMTMEKAGNIWQEDWPAGDLSVLANRYVEAISIILSYVPRQYVREVPCYSCDAKRLARDIETASTLDRVRRIYYQAFRFMHEKVTDAANRNIRRYRMGTLIIKTSPGARVKVTQLEHDFLFGSSLNAQMWVKAEDYESGRKWLNDFYYLNDKERYKFIEANRQRYYQLIKDNFNYGVHQNAMKWHNTEPTEEGDIYYTAAERVTQWCMENGIKMRGHCILWCVPRFVPEWQKTIDDASLRRNIERRCKEVAGRFKGRIDDWDLNNEMLHARWYRDRLGEEIIGEMFGWVKQANPDAVLCLNDFRILQGRGRSDLQKYIKQARTFLDKGYPLGGINCQAHGWRGDTNIGWVRRALYKLAELKLPIKISEYVVDSHTDNEEYAAHNLDELYRVFFGHPQVEGILMWGCWEGTHYLPKAALWKKDFTPTLAAKAYRNLVFNEWWTRWQGRADKSGVCKVPVFYGKHSVTINGKQIEVNFPKSEGKKKTIVQGR